MVETPLPAGVNLRAVQDAVPAEKDVDGASTLSLGRLFSGQPGFVPATAAAVMALVPVVDAVLDVAAVPLVDCGIDKPRL